MKLLSAPVLGCGLFFMTLAMDTKCDYKDVAGAGLMDGLWFAAAVSASDQGDADLQGQIDDLSGQLDDLSGRVQPGPAGLACWDLNQNGVADPEEDVNGDGVWDVQDCRGADGADGANGQPGAEGGNCWDTIGDYNGDGTSDAQDCLDWVVAHVEVPPGEAGDSCWDTIGDYNGDGVTDGQDCLDWTADHTEAGPGETAIIARGYVDSFGTLHRGDHILNTAYVSAGEYEVVVNLAGVDVDLQDETLMPADFPVLITVYATSADPLPWSQDIAALVAHYKYDSDNSLDRATGTLTLRVYILDAQTGAHTGASFSIAVLRP
jgi:hypothetical protein